MIDILLKNYNSYPSASEWLKENAPSQDLIYKSGAERQVKASLSISNLVRFDLPEPRVASYHTSKSVKLPVLAFKIWHYENGGAFCFIRDNFHDVKLSVVSEFPINMHYSYMHHEMTQEEYDAEKKRCIDYNSRPPITISEEEKIDDNWMLKWSHNKIIRKDNKIWKAYGVQEVYCEGINKLKLPREVFRPYETGYTMFTICAASFAHIAYLLEHIENNIQDEVYLKLKAAQGE